MGRVAPGKRAGLRRAVVASLGVHAGLVAIVLVVLNSGRDTHPPGVGVKSDTRVRDIEIRFAAEDIAVAVPTAPSAPPAASAPAEQQPPEPTRTPHTLTAPQPLSADVVAMIRRPTQVSTAIADTNVKPAAARVSPPMHGAMRAGQSVVYVLDCSGSMGEFGKFDLARDALLATLRLQPTDVKFQVIAYNNAARALVPGSCVPATPANLAEARAQLAPLKAAGRSNHTEAVRLAATLKPDVIVLLTDATDLSATQFKAAFAAAGKSVVLCVARVNGGLVCEPRELK